MPSLADIAAWLFAVFVVQPFEAEIGQTMERVRAAPEVMTQVRACAAEAPARVRDRAAADWWGTTGTAIGVFVGWQSADSVIASLSPTCADAVARVRPLLQAREA
jgi:hypothetical protein